MRKLAVVFFLLVILSDKASADVVHIKGGGRVEGIIQEETADRIVIDMGFGTMTVNKVDIDHIEEASPQQREKLKQQKFDYEIERGEWAPPGYDEIRVLYRNTKSDKNELLEARRKSNSVRSEISEREKRAAELIDMLNKTGHKLESIDAKSDIRRYNSIVTKMNSISGHINDEGNRVRTLYEQERTLNTTLARLVSKYRSSFQLFKDALRKEQEALDEKKMTADEHYFFEAMSKKVDGMEDDFKKNVALYKPDGNQIIVDTLINNSVSAQLLLDTGASMVAISSDVASRLGINYDEIPVEISVKLADNSVTTAKPIILGSVKVADAEVKDVQAAIMNREAIGGVDGLLGMSYLSHFVIKVDSAENKLILERVL